MYLGCQVTLGPYLQAILTSPNKSRWSIYGIGNRVLTALKVTFYERYLEIN